MRALAMVAGLSLIVSQSHAQTRNDPRPPRPVRYDLAIDVDLDKQMIAGAARIRLRNDLDAPMTEASLLLYRLLAAREVRDSAGNPIPFRQDIVAFEDFTKLQVNQLRVPLTPALPPGQERTIEVRYAGHVLGYAETGMAYVRDRVDTAYTLLRDDSFAYPMVGYPSMAVRRAAPLPSFDYMALITVPSTHSVANGGQLVDRIERGATTTYVFRNVKPAWRMDFGVARFGTLRFGKLAVYYLPEDSAGAVRVMDRMQRTLGLYWRWFGPLTGDSPFSVIEIPDGWGSQADVSSVLQAAAAFRDPERERELYHEIAHLWSVPDTDRPSPRWNEGFSTFMESLTTDSLTGSSQMDSTIMRNTRWLAGRARADSNLRTVPLAQYGVRDMTGMSYWVGSVMFYSLYRLVGHDDFCKIIGEHYRMYSKGGGSTADFVKVAKRVTPIDLTGFWNDWMYTTHWTEVVASAQTTFDLYGRYLPVSAGRH